MILTSWKPKFSRGTTLALMGALFLGMIMQLSVLAQEAQVEVRDEESYRMLWKKNALYNRMNVIELKM